MAELEMEEKNKLKPPGSCCTGSDPHYPGKIVKLTSFDRSYNYSSSLFSVIIRICNSTRFFYRRSNYHCVGSIGHLTTGDIPW